MFNIVAFYLGFKEKPSCVQYLGIIIMLGCIVCLGFAAGDKKEKKEN